jgi:hypothetical protein
MMLHVIAMAGTKAADQLNRRLCGLVGSGVPLYCWAKITTFLDNIGEYNNR